MEFVSAILVGLLTGAFSKSLFPRWGGGMALAFVLGIMGSIGAYVLVHALEWNNSAPAFVASVIGALGFIALHRAVFPDPGQL